MKKLAAKILALKFSPLAKVHPKRRLAYIDKIDIWLQDTLPYDEYCWLQSECGKNIIPFQGPSPFDSAYRVRLSLFQPSWEAITYLAKKNNVHFNGLEVALDLIFESDIQAQCDRELIDKYFVKPNHRVDCKYVGDEGEATMYTERRRSRNKVVIYHTRPSKLIGEPCVHIEWRFKGVEALRRAGFQSLTDLLEIDFREFWKRRLIFYVVDFPAFGRRFWNMLKGTRRRKPWISPGTYQYDYDVRQAQLQFRYCERMQVFWDKFGRSMGGIRSCVKRIDVEDLLPENIR